MVGVSVVAGLLGWTAVAVVVLSLVGPLSGAVTPAAAAVLVALHLAVAAVLIPLMRRSSVGQSE